VLVVLCGRHSANDITKMIVVSSTRAVIAVLLAHFTGKFKFTVAITTRLKHDYSNLIFCSISTLIHRHKLHVVCSHDDHVDSFGFLIFHLIPMPTNVS